MKRRVISNRIMLTAIGNSGFIGRATKGGTIVPGACTHPHLACNCKHTEKNSGLCYNSQLIKDTCESGSCGR